MDDDVRAFGMELGRKALAQEWAGVQAMLAPWLQKSWSVEKVQGFFEDEYRATLEARRQRQVLDEPSAAVFRRADGQAGLRLLL